MYAFTLINKIGPVVTIKFAFKIIGVMNRGNEPCGKVSPALTMYASIFLNWLIQNGGKEVKECSKNVPY